MAGEHAFWALIKKHKPIDSVMFRINDKLVPGYPDVAYCLGKDRSGWFEMKSLTNWPTKESSFNLDADQGIYLNQWTRAGGKAFLLARCKGEYLLLHGAFVDVPRTMEFAIDHAHYFGKDLGQCLERL